MDLLLPIVVATMAFSLLWAMLDNRKMYLKLYKEMDSMQAEISSISNRISNLNAMYEKDKIDFNDIIEGMDNDLVLLGDYIEYAQLKGKINAATENLKWYKAQLAEYKKRVQ